MKKEYKVGETIAISAGHENVPEGNYVVIGIGNDISGNDPSKYKKIYECKEAKTHRIFHIHESNVDEVTAAEQVVQSANYVIEAPEPEPEAVPEVEVVIHEWVYEETPEIAPVAEEEH